jgi:LuxR family maltose regulon positive regulatory protein
LIEEAIKHALDAGDSAAAGRLVAQHGFNLVSEEQWITLQRWLNLFPENLLSQDPALVILAVWTHLVNSREAELVSSLDRAEALLYDSQKDESAALKALTESLTLAEPGGFIRLFVDLGPQMADLLKRLQKQNVAVDYIESILAAFRDDQRAVGPEAADHPIASAHQPLRASTLSLPLVEPLTNRELDVLELLAQRLSNQEIADKLFIAPTTVKGHLKNIYQKLEVGKRREAVKKAKKIGILSASV